MNADQRASVVRRLPRESAAAAGVALVLAALVLWGGLGSATRLVLLYGISGCLVAAGVWLEPKAEALQGYGRIVVAGGLAGIYFTTYAAHYFPSFAIIRSGWIATALLLGCAGLIAWFADQRASQSIATLAIALASFATTLHPVSLFTLASNLVLAGIAVWFLVRRGKVITGFVGLIAIYVGFLIWWPFDDGRFDAERYLELREYWIALSFFGAYWMVFTWGGFRAAESTLSTPLRLTYLTLNNALLYAFGVLILPPRFPAWMWKFTAAVGVVLLVVSVFAGKFPRVQRGYLVQGLSLMMLAIISMITGWEPATLLAVASLFLVLSTHERDQWVRQYVGFGTALLAVLFTWQPVNQSNTTGLGVGLLTGGLLLFNAWWVSRSKQIWWRGAVSFFAGLGLLVWMVTTFTHTPNIHRSPMLALEAVILTFSFALLGVREAPYLAKAFVLAAQVVWFMQLGSFTPPSWNAPIVAAATLLISHWWQKCGRSLMPDWELRLVQGISAAGAVAIMLIWVEGSLLSGAAAMVVLSSLTVAALVYAATTSDDLLVLFSQLFTAAAIGEFVGLMSHAPLPSALEAVKKVSGALILRACGREDGRRQHR